MTIIIDGTVGANKAVVLDANGKLPAIDGSLLTTLNATQVTTGSIATARLDTGTTNGKVLVLDGSGNMPAIAAGSMTGVSAATKSSSDPTVSTNPATGLGTKWINTTSGEIFILTDATAGENVWTSTGGTSGDIQAKFAGETYGYSMGGTPTTNTIQKFSLASATANSTDVADLTVARGQCRGTHSQTYGYCAAGHSSYDVTIDKHQFATTNNASDVGDLIQRAPDHAEGTSTTHGYAMAGHNGVDDSGQNVIQKYSFSTDGNSTDVGDVTVARTQMGGCSDWTGNYGYIVGGAAFPSPGRLNVIDRVSFTSDGNAVDVGDLTQVTAPVTASSSPTHGYAAGGHNGSAATNVISRFAFAATANASDVGDLTVAKYNGHSCSSETYGYYMGASSPSLNVIERYAFASSGNAVDVGDLLSAISAMAGNQI